MPILWALANPKIGEREVLTVMLHVEAGVVAEHGGILLISDKGIASRPFERQLADQGIELSRAAGVLPATGLGRRKRREWKAQLPERLQADVGTSR